MNNHLKLLQEETTRPEGDRAVVYFAHRATRAKPDAIDRILNRSDGESPRAGDELPENDVAKP